MNVDNGDVFLGRNHANIVCFCSLLSTVALHVFSFSETVLQFIQEDLAENTAYHRQDLGTVPHP